MMDWTTIGNITALITIAAAGYSVLRWGGRVKRWLGRRLSSYARLLPLETVRSIPKTAWWHLGSQQGRPAMQIVSRWFVTNISDHPVSILQVRLNRGPLRIETKGLVFMHGAIAPRATCAISADFWITPPFRKRGQSFCARAILIDHLGNRHLTERVEFASDWKPRADVAAPPSELVHEIHDPVKKQIVTILKDEVERYRACGRSVGGLGSVQVTYEGRTLAGIGYQGRKANSPKQQWIVPDPEKAKLHSDNLERLLNFFTHQTKGKRQQIKDALLESVDPRNEYACIGYFFLFALFRMGSLREALQAIRERLPAAPKYSFDDAIRMLSGLLQYEYQSFDQNALDEIERFMVGLEGSLHHLKERCTAARVAKLQH